MGDGIFGFVAKEAMAGWQNLQQNAERRRITGLSPYQAYREARVALDKKEYPLALLLFQRAAPDVPEAATFAGVMHRDGIGTAVNIEAARLYLNLAASRGEPAAKARLAQLDAEASPPPPRPQPAKEPPKPEPEERFASAADCYRAAHGAKESGDVQRAFRLFRQAAQGGDREAMNSLGYAYGTGKGTDRDNVQAAYWYGRAAEHGWSVGQYNYALYLCDGHGCAENKAEAARWMRRAAEQDYAPAQRELGRYCLEGIGIARSIDEARRWLTKAAAQGEPQAPELLAQLPPEPKPEPPKTPPPPARGTFAWAVAELELTEAQAGNRIFINAAFRAAMDMHHPDKGGSTEKAQAVNEARDILLARLGGKT